MMKIIFPLSVGGFADYRHYLYVELNDIAIAVDIEKNLVYDQNGEVYIEDYIKMNYIADYSDERIVRPDDYQNQLINLRSL